MSLDDVEGEVGLDGVQMCLVVLLLKQLGGLKDSELFRLPVSPFLLCTGTGLSDQLKGGLLARAVEHCLLSASNGGLKLFDVCGPREKALPPNEQSLPCSLTGSGCMSLSQSRLCSGFVLAWDSEWLRKRGWSWSVGDGARFPWSTMETVSCALDSCCPQEFFI